MSSVIKLKRLLFLFKVYRFLILVRKKRTYIFYILKLLKLTTEKEPNNAIIREIVRLIKFALKIWKILKDFFLPYFEDENFEDEDFKI
jgi:hypothetical protein